MEPTGGDRVRPVASPAFASRLPAKKSSFHSLREARKDYLESVSMAAPSSQPQLQLHVSTSPTVPADVLSPDTANNPSRRYSATNDRRASIDSQQSTSSYGRPSSSLSGTSGRTRIPRPSPATNQAATAVPPTPRQSLSFSDAYRMAGEEEAVVAAAAAAQGSPSPAPRPWRTGSNTGASGSTSASRMKSRNSMPGSTISASESRMERILAQSPLSFGGRKTARRLGESAGLPSPPLQPERSDTKNKRNTFGGSSSAAELRRIRYEEDQVRMEVAKSERNGLFTPKSRASPKTASQSVREVRSRSSLSNISSNSSRSTNGNGSGNGNGSLSTKTTHVASPGGSTAGTGIRHWGLRKPQSQNFKATKSPPVTSVTEVSGDVKMAENQTTKETKTTNPMKPELALELPPAQEDVSPTKSIAWDADVDLDFTAADLMMSNSPPVKIMSVEETSSTEDGNEHVERAKASPTKERNSKIDDIRQLEVEVGLQFPIDTNDELLPHFALAPEGDQDAPQSDQRVKNVNFDGGFPTERTNKKIDEIRASEIASLSKRALATARLDEIRERNGTFRAGDGEPAPDQERDIPVAADGDGEALPNTPVTIFRKNSRDRGRALVEVDGNRSKSSSSSSSSHSRNESQELLRSLARVTTLTSPGNGVRVEGKDKAGKELYLQPHAQPQSALKSAKKPKSNGSLRGGSGVSNSSNSSGEIGRETDTLRPSVGFANVRDLTSESDDELVVETISTKRSSMANSDGDPVDRIEAEMKLFAPTENQSERGSIRAPSPAENSGGEAGNGTEDKATADDATPRPSKTSNPLLQQTPRVTGAYVETPVTDRTEKIQEVLGWTGAEDAEHTSHSEPRTSEHEKAPPLQPSLSSLVPVLRTSSNNTSETSSGNSADDGNINVKSAAKNLGGMQRRSRSLPRTERHALLNSAKPISARDDLLAIKRAQRQPLDDPTLDNFDELLAMQAQRSASDTTGRDGGLLPGSNTLTPERLRRMSDSVTASLLDIQRARNGIAGLEDRVSQEEKAVKARRDEKAARDGALGPRETKMKSENEEPTVKREEETIKSMESVGVSQHRQRRSGSGKSTSPIDKTRRDSVQLVRHVISGPEPTYVRIALPQLWSQGRLTVLGLLAVLAAVWLSMESTMCALYCRPETCGGSIGMGLVSSGMGSGSSGPCRWSPDDPSFGVAIPVKLDQWLAGGRGRVLATWAAEELGDWAADAWDVATGTDIKLIDPTYFSFDEKRRHRRRLQKRGLLAPWTASAEAQPQLEMWRRVREARRQAREEAEEAGENGSKSVTDDRPEGRW